VTGIGDRLRGLAETMGGAPAVLEGGVATTWAVLDALTDAAAIGVVPGAVVPFEAPLSVETIARILGVLRGGGVAAPIAPGLTEHERALAQAAVRRDALPPGTGLVVMTSGTTGQPRGVAHGEASLAASADAWRAVLPPASGWVLALGLAHVAGLGVVWRAIADGVPIRIAPAADAVALLEALHDPTMSHVSLVPTQLVRLLDLVSDAPPPPNVRAIPLGGGTIPGMLVRRAAAAGWPVWPTYGLSEMGSGVTALPYAEAVVASASAGRPLPGVMLAIEGADVDGVGEILVSGPSAFLGYVGDGSRTAGLPFRTGDLGRLDADGRLEVVDRRTDRIVRGGENVAPTEVEAVLVSHPAVADAGVVARVDAHLGHVPVAAIVLREGMQDPGSAVLAGWCRARLAGYKVPVRFVRLDVLPRTASGKLRRADLRALLDGGTEGQLERPGGDRLGWRVTGNGPRPLVLLHGTLSTAGQLGPLAGLLADRCGATVHALDRRGSGTGRLAVPHPLHIAVHVSDIVAYLDARGIGRVHLVGVSFGGVVALETAARHPDRVASVAAYEPPYGAVVTPEMAIAFPDRTGLDAAYARGGAPAAAQAFMRAVAGDDVWERLSPRSRAFLEEEGLQAVVDGSMLGLDPAGLASISAPVLLLTGSASDPFYSPIADEIARRIPGVLRATLDGLAHPGPIVRPDRVAEAVSAFLEPAAE
jgi:acyl-CoA synthetase (AMP-forming)/AMP-acid ligase II/pimeloyl-ACP methyl ester carboxylesterase